MKLRSAYGRRHKADGMRQTAYGMRQEADGTRHTAGGMRHEANGLRHAAKDMRLKTCGKTEKEGTNNKRKDRRYGEVQI